jgi:pyruvyltransferase
MTEAPLKLYWSSGKPNFGDWLSPAVCRLLSGRTIEFAEPNRCDLIAVGSILHRLKSGWFSRRVHVWGTGFMEEQSVVPSRHHFHAVRGWLTARLIRGAKIQHVGDPGLLVDCLLPDHGTIPKMHRVGIVPHYKDRDHPQVGALVAQLPGATVLDVFVEPLEFLRRAAACEFILSSSLHGLIVADSFGIPNGWMELSDSVRGAGFKFADYYSAFGIDNPQPVDLSRGISQPILEDLAARYQRPGLATLKEGLLASFPFKRSENIHVLG